MIFGFKSLNLFQKPFKFIQEVTREQLVVRSYGNSLDKSKFYDKHVLFSLKKNLPFRDVKNFAKAVNYGATGAWIYWAATLLQLNTHIL